GFLRRLLAHEDVIAGDLDTGLVERDAESLVPEGVPAEVYAAAALLRQFPAAPPAEPGWTDPFDARTGWRLGGRPAWTPHHFRIPGHEPVPVRVRGTAATAELLLGEPGEAGALTATLGGTPSAPGRVSGSGGVGDISVSLDGVTHHFTVATSPEGVWLGRDGDSWHVLDHDPVEAALSGARHGGADTLAAPMPGTVTVVKVAVGDEVEAGQSLLVVEAMKMEHVISAPHAGTVTELDVTPGTTVAMDQILAVVTPHEEEDA
ncbi:biotin/lipoyl-containing protein, partial [Streptomyces narbonensis]